MVKSAGNRLVVLSASGLPIRSDSPVSGNGISKTEAQIPWSRGGGLPSPQRGEGGEETHHSWNPSTQTGSLPSLRGTWGQWCGGTSPCAVGTESHRTCTWGGAGRAANGSRCCCEASLSGTCGQEERASAAGAEWSTLPSLYAMPSSLCSGSPAATLGLGPQGYPQGYLQQRMYRDHQWGQTSQNPTLRPSFFPSVLHSATSLSPRQV